MKLSEKKLEELKDKKISIEELNDKYFYTKKDGINVENILKLLNENICSFKELVNKFKSIKDADNDPCLYRLLENEKLFEELRQNNTLNKEDLKCLLNTIDDYYKLYNLCNNTPLINYILNEFVLDKEILNKLNKIRSKSMFDYIEYYYKNNEEILKLNELNKYTYIFELAKDQKLELIEVLRNNEIAVNRLKEIVDNHLEDNYDFDSLLNCLKKIEKKNLINI